MDSKRAQEILSKHGKAALKELALEVVLVAIKEAVQKSATPVDDIVFAALEKAAVEAIEKL